MNNILAGQRLTISQIEFVQRIFGIGYQRNYVFSGQTPGLAPGVIQLCPLRGRDNSVIFALCPNFFGVGTRNDRDH